MRARSRWAGRIEYNRVGRWTADTRAQGRHREDAQVSCPCGCKFRTKMRPDGQRADVIWSCVRALGRRSTPFVVVQVSIEHTLQGLYDNLRLAGGWGE